MDISTDDTSEWKSWALFPHNGYGAFYNKIYISPDMRRLVKTSSCEEGKKKLNNEKIFYDFVHRSVPGFPIPKIHRTSEDSLEMEYLKGYTPLYQHYHVFSQKQQHAILLKVQKYLDMLHASSSLPRNLECIRRLMEEEMISKVKKRFQDVQDILAPYLERIKYINGKSFIALPKLIERFTQTIHNFCMNAECYSLVPIHGDPQFHNILYSPHHDDIVFIDPRAYFGDMVLYGMPQYDQAKILFALSGYDTFDASSIDFLEIEGQNIILDTSHILMHDSIRQSPELTRHMMISIWLGNAHCFRHSVPKTVYSFFMALYIAREFID